MDASLKQDAVVAETSIGVTPSTPAFLLPRLVSIGGGVSRPNTRSPERVNHRQANSMTQGNVQVQKSISGVWVRDAGVDLFWQSLLCGAFATNVLKNGSTPKPFTLEEKYHADAGGTDFYRRTTGCQVDSATISFRNDGNPGQLTFNAMGRAETTATSAISGATYAAAAPGYDPVTLADVSFDSIFGLSSPGIVNFQGTIANNLRPRYAAGSASPRSYGLGDFDFSGTIEFYLGAMADYSTFVTKQTGQVLQLTIGSVTDNKDVFKCFGCDVWNPMISDGGKNTDDTVTLNFMAKYSVSDTASLSLTRQVPA